MNAWTACLLFLLGGANAALLLHTLRKVRSQDWVVALSWGVGGAMAVGTGLWLLQLLAWRAEHPLAAAWLNFGPFLAAWCAAVAGVALAVFAGRGMPSAPSQCWTRNVVWKPMNSSQKCTLPRLSLSILPVHFGHQK